MIRHFFHQHGIVVALLSGIYLSLIHGIPPAMGVNTPYNRLQCLERTPTVDGVIQEGEWPVKHQILLSRAYHAANGIKLLFAWDNAYLYLGAEIEDSDLRADGNGQGTGEYWDHIHDDAIEWYFDIDVSRDAFLMPTDRFIAINIGNITDPKNGSGIVSRRSFNQGGGDGSSKGVVYPGELPQGLTYKVQYQGTVNNPSDTDKGYSVEMAVPWSFLGRNPPADGELMGVNVIVISDDTGGERDWSNNVNLAPPSRRFTEPVRPDEYVEMSVSPNHDSQSGLQGPANYQLMQFHANADVTPPGAITALSAMGIKPRSVLLKWQVPGDNDQTGVVQSIDIRYATTPITEENFYSATHSPAKPFPPYPSNDMTSWVMGLTPNTTYYFALRALDEAGNRGPITTLGPVTTNPLSGKEPLQGMVQAAPTGRYFITESGTNYIPIGHHFLFQDDAIRHLYQGEIWTGEIMHDFSSDDDAMDKVTTYLDKLAANGVNLMRIFLEDLSLPLENASLPHNASSGAYWIEYPKGTFNPQMATFLTDLLHLCSQRGIYVLISPFDTFYYDEQFNRTIWSVNQGGPLTDINNFFLNNDVLEMCKNRWSFVINTIIASGYIDAVFGYDILNEWDSWEWTQTSSDPILDASNRITFLTALANHIRSLDPEHMLVSGTTTIDPRGPLGDYGYYNELYDAALPHLYLPGNREPWNNPDRIQGPAVIREQSRAITWWTLNRLNRLPVLNGEWGPSDGWMPDPTNPVYFDGFTESDDEALMRKLYYAEMAAGAAGPGIRMQGGVRGYEYKLHLSDTMLATQKTLSTFVENNVTTPKIDFTQFNSRNLLNDISVEGTSAVLDVTGCTDGQKGIIYLAQDLNKTNQSVTDATLSLKNLEGGSFMAVEFWNPAQLGAAADLTEYAMTPFGTMTVAIPAFEEEWAIKFYEVYSLRTQTYRENGETVLELAFQNMEAAGPVDVYCLILASSGNFYPLQISAEGEAYMGAENTFAPLFVNQSLTTGTIPTLRLPVTPLNGEVYDVYTAADGTGAGLAAIKTLHRLLVYF